MPMVSVGDALGVEAVGARFLAGICSQDWEQVESCFTPDARFRALIPSGLREGEGAAAAMGYLRQWLGDADQLVLLDSDVRSMLDRLAIRYRLRAHEGRWHIGEQQVYCDVRDNQIERMDLLCSGFRPETQGDGA
jgi:hypothetical protein